ALLLAGLDGGTVPVDTGRGEFPYLVAVTWDDAGALIVAQSRDQCRMRLSSADPRWGAAAVLREDPDEHWVDIVPGVPGWTGDGKIAWTADHGGAKRLLVAAPAELADAAPVTPPGLQARAVADTDGDAVLFTASGADPADVGLWLYRQGELVRITPEHGVRAGRGAGGTRVVVGRSLAERGVAVTVRTDGRPGGQAPIASHAELPPPPVPRPTCSPPAAARSAPRCCSRPGTSRARGSCRCCSTRTAGRTRSGWWPRRAPSWTRSGSRGRGSPWWWPTGEARRGAGRAGIAR